jgi:heme exporter protein C
VLLSYQSDSVHHLSCQPKSQCEPCSHGGCRRSLDSRDWLAGSIWGRAVWGIWWTWDARLTATLVLWLIYVAYLVLRKVSTGGQSRTLAAVLAIFAYCDVPIVYMSTRWWRTQHPAPVFFGGPNAGIDPNMQPAVSWNIYAWLAWAVLLAGLRIAIERRRQLTAQAEAAQALEFIA